MACTDQGEALAMADRIAGMKDGRIKQIGTPQDIYLRPRTLESRHLVPMCSDGTVQWHGSRVADYWPANSYDCAPLALNYCVWAPTRSPAAALP